MGKSSKKVKSDRINALKKQYDAFLAEDKKRKERNDFILDRLDKMRYSSAAVQFRHSPPMLVEPQAAPYHTGYETENFTKYDNMRRSSVAQKYPPLDIHKKPLEDSLLLQEISKKYILIPKQRSLLVNDCDQDISSNVNDSSDWKSKYEILNQLKQSEKEEPSNKQSGKIFPDLKIDEIPLDGQHKKVTIKGSETNKYVNNDEAHLGTFKIDSSIEHLKPDNELPSKLQNEDCPKHDFFNNTLENSSMGKQNKEIEINKHNNNCDGSRNLEFESQNKHLDLNSQLSNLDADSSDTKIKAVDIFQTEPEYGSTLNTTVNHSVIKNNVSNENNSINIDAEHMSQIEAYEEPVDKYNIDAVDSVNAVYHEENNIINSSPLVNDTDEVKQINHEPYVDDNIKQVENVEYPIDIINAQEFTPIDDVRLQDGVNVNLEGHATNGINFDSNPQQGDHNIDQANYDESTYEIPQPEPVAEGLHNQDGQSGIEAFNAEQTEMFYPEHTEENYAYDQAGVGDAYNPEYAQNENYQQNEDYTYYEGAQTEQPLTEINEHEETTQHYDQSYEEQYGGYEQEGYTQDQAYEQQPQEYEPQPQGYEPQPQEYAPQQQEYASQQQEYAPQQQEYASQQQEYEPQVFDQVQPETDHLQYEQQNYETVDGIEQQIDNEEGYVEKHDVEDNKIEKTAPEKQQTEQVADL